MGAKAKKALKKNLKKAVSCRMNEPIDFLVYFFYIFDNLNLNF